MPRRIEDFRGLKQASRVKLLHAVQKVPGQKLEELAEAVGIHINTARDHLNVLEKEGFITSRPITTGSRGRPPVVFEPVQHSGTNHYADQRAYDSQARGDLLRRLYPEDNHGDGLDEDALHQIDTLYAHLEDVGLEPVPDDDSLGMKVVPCTYHNLLSEEDNMMICSVHARLIQDQLSQVDGPLAMKELRPFVTQHSCHVQLRIKDQSTTGSQTAEISPGTAAPLARSPQHPSDDERERSDDH